MLDSHHQHEHVEGTWILERHHETIRETEKRIQLEIPEEELVSR